MKDIIKHSIEDGNNIGLYRISFPTGSGKSYESTRYMAEHYMDLDDGRYFFFLTSNKINLPKKMLLKWMGEEEYNKNVIVLKSYEEYILENFNMKLIPERFWSKEVLELDKAIENYNKKINKSVYDSEDKKEITNKLNTAEYNFRSYIYSIVKEIKVNLKSNNEQMKNEEIEKEIYAYLKNNCDYRWIGKIYENIFVKDYKIILMSITKFMKKNQPFYEPRYSFINGEITNNAIVFIDEFDSSKETIINELIDRSINNICEYILLSETICRNMLNYKKFPKIVQSAFDSHKTELDRLLKLCETNYNQYKLDLKYKCEELKGRNFLFNDFTYQSIVNSDKRIYIQYDEEKENMAIKYRNKNSSKDLDESDNVIKMYKLIRTLNGMIYAFKDFIYRAAKTYESLCNSNNELNQDSMNFENALSTLCSLFNFDKKAEKFMKNGLDDKYARNRIYKDRNIAVKTNNYYSRGFKFYELQNKLSNNEFTLFNITELGETPESIVASLALKAKVIGLSATINVDSVLCNYSQDYLKRILGENYREVNDEDFRRVKERYEYLNRKYCSSSNPKGDIKIHVSCVDRILKQNGKSIKNQIEVIYKDKKNIRILDKFLSAQCRDNEFQKERYLSVAYVFKEFILNPSLKSFLCLTNPTVKVSGKFDGDVIQKMFEVIIEENHIHISNKDDSNYYIVLKSGNDFEIQKEAIAKRLHDGEKIFVMAAYGTLEAGQNLTYLPAKTDELVNLNDKIDLNDSRNSYKDFDAIYLGQMTNLITNLYDQDNEFGQKELFKYLDEIENLYENNEISYDELQSAIKNVFYKYSDRNSKSFDPIKSLLKSKCGKVTKKTVQSVGRLCRTFNKRPDIYIYISRSVFDMFDPTLIKNDLICPEVQAICDYVDEYRERLIYNEINNRAERISFASKDYLFLILSYQWDESRVKLWKDLRDKVLKMPTVCALVRDKDVIYREYYISSSNKLNKYYFYEVNDFSEVYILFDDNKNDAIRRLKTRFEKNKRTIEEVMLKECSFENSRLELILNYDGLKDYFKANDYATTFKQNDYILSPVLYQNIYKGALGEVAGKFILEKELGIELEELNTEFYEFFDYQLKDGVYIDFKHWRMNSVDKDTYLEKINTKLAKIGGRRAYIINIIDDDQENNLITETYNGRIVEVPFLLNTKTFKANKKIIDMLLEDLQYDR